MNSPWLIRFFVLTLFISLVKTLPVLGWLILAVAALIVLAKLIYESRLLPRFMMDALDRLTNRSALEDRMKKTQATPVLIDAQELAAYVKSKVIGQDSVASEVAQQIRRRLALAQRDKPVGVFCFAGPPGVGKTYFAKVLAEKLYGNAKHLVFLDMSQMNQPHTAATLFGQAKGYVGSNSYGTLTRALRDQPSCVVLLDEFEKAHSEVHKRFLTAWNDGFITETSDGAHISTSEAIFILTTNAASRLIGELAKQHESDADRLQFSVRQALGDAGFAPEILSRIDQIFSFRPLEGLDIARVVALEIEKLVTQCGLTLASQGIDPEILIDAIEREQKLKPIGGVRETARAIERQVTDSLIDAKVNGATHIILRAEGGKVLAMAAEPPSDAQLQPALA
jgi:ATP-dependent Clp protease ATP-binding subunit ClpA